MTKKEFLETELVNYQSDIDLIYDVLINEELEGSLYAKSVPYQEIPQGTLWNRFVCMWSPEIKYKFVGLDFYINIMEMKDHDFIKWFLKSGSVGGGFKTLYSSSDESICSYINLEFYKQPNSILDRIKYLTGYEVNNFSIMYDTLILNLSHSQGVEWDLSAITWEQ